MSTNNYIVTAGDTAAPPVEPTQAIENIDGNRFAVSSTGVSPPACAIYNKEGELLVPLIFLGGGFVYALADLGNNRLAVGGEFIQFLDTVFNYTLIFV